MAYTTLNANRKALVESFVAWYEITELLGFLYTLTKTNFSVVKLRNEVVAKFNDLGKKIYGPTKRFPADGLYVCENQKPLSDLALALRTMLDLRDRNAAAKSQHGVSTDETTANTMIYNVRLSIDQVIKWLSDEDIGIDQSRFEAEFAWTP